MKRAVLKRLLLSRRDVANVTNREQQLFLLDGFYKDVLLSACSICGVKSRFNRSFCR